MDTIIFYNMKITVDSNAIIIGALIAISMIVLDRLFNNKGIIVNGNNNKIIINSGEKDDGRPGLFDPVPENGPYGIRRASLPYWRA